MTGTTAMTVDLGTCARALSDAVALVRGGEMAARGGPRTRGTEEDALREKESVTSVNLRAVVERRGLALNESFLDCSMRAQSKLSQVEATLEALDGARDRMRNAVEGSKQKTSALVRNPDRARADLDVIKSRRELVNSFAVDFQLTKAHVEALTLADEARGRRLGDADGDGDGDGCRRTSAVVFSSPRARQGDSGQLRQAANTEQQRAGLELMERHGVVRKAAHSFDDGSSPSAERSPNRMISSPMVMRARCARR